MKNKLFIIFAGRESHEGMGRVANALIMAKELKDNIPMSKDYMGHPSFAKYVEQDYKIITF